LVLAGCAQDGGSTGSQGQEAGGSSSLAPATSGSGENPSGYSGVGMRGDLPAPVWASSSAAEEFPSPLVVDAPQCANPPSNLTWETAALIPFAQPLGARLCPTGTGVYFRTSQAQPQDADLMLQVIFAQGAAAQNYDFVMGVMLEGGTIQGVRCNAAAGVDEVCLLTLPQTGPVFIRAFSTVETTGEQSVTLIVRSAH